MNVKWKLFQKMVLDPEEVKYEVFNSDGELANETNMKEKADYAAYKSQIRSTYVKI
mgnify:CR=1 FL=1